MSNQVQNGTHSVRYLFICMKRAFFYFTILTDIVFHCRLVEGAGEQQRRPCAEIFLEEWGCSGRKRPTLADLLQLLIEAELYRAADYVAVDLLQGT